MKDKYLLLSFLKIFITKRFGLQMTGNSPFHGTKDSKCQYSNLRLSLWLAQKWFHDELMLW